MSPVPSIILQGGLAHAQSVYARPGCLLALLPQGATVKHARIATHYIPSSLLPEVRPKQQQRQ